jgi:hypothetical protein
MSNMPLSETNPSKTSHPGSRFHTSESEVRDGLVHWNVIGCAAVLATYIAGAAIYPDYMRAIWSNVPEPLNVLHTVNIVLAAFGYVLTAWILNSARAESLNRTLLAAITLTLSGSILWVPLNLAHLEAPTNVLLFALRLDLFVVGLGALGMLVSIVKTRPATIYGGNIVAFLATMPVIIQVVLFDSIL